MTRRLSTILIGLLVALGIALVAPAPGAAALPDPVFAPLGAVELPNGFQAIEVDAGTGRVFVSSPTSSLVSVIEPDGQLWGGFSVPGAGALLIDGQTLYVASTTAGRIDAFDTTTLAKTGSYGGGRLQNAHGLVKAGGRLWTTTGCKSQAQLVSIVPATGAVTVHPDLHGLNYCLFLFTTPVHPNVILTFETGISPTDVERLDVSTGVPERVGALATDNSNSTDGRVLPDGETFALGSGAPYEVRTFGVDPLRPLGVVYPLTSGPVAVDSTAGAGGLIAAGTRGFYTDDVAVFRLGDPSKRFLTHDFGSTSHTVWDRGVAFNGDGTRLYVVAGDPFVQKTATLHVFGPPRPGGNYHPLPPARIFDTRDGGPAGRIGPGGTVDIAVTGRGGVPATGVAAVAMNVTVTQPSARSFLTLYPTGTAPPDASNLNFAAGETVPNLVVVNVGTGGKISAYNSAGSVDAILDVAGWFSDASAAGDAGRYHPVAPARIVDTRGGGVRLGPGASLVVQVAGQGGVPEAGAMAAVLNVVATGTTAPSFLTVYPSGEARPLASTLNFDAGATVSNRTMVKLGAGGLVTIYNLAGSVDIVVDVAGWYSDGSAASPAGGYSPVPPTRILDTRDGPLGPLVGGSARELRVTGRAGMPPVGVRAVVLNATVVDPVDAGFLTIFPADADLPLTSDVNYTGGGIRSNLSVVGVSADGRIGLYASATTHVVVDVAGWFS